MKSQFRYRFGRTFHLVSFLFIAAACLFTAGLSAQCTVSNLVVGFALNVRSCSGQSFQAPCSSSLLSVAYSGNNSISKPDLVEVRSGNGPSGALLYSNSAPVWAGQTHTLTSSVPLTGGQTYTVLFIRTGTSQGCLHYFINTNPISTGTLWVYEGVYGSGSWSIYDPAYDLTCNFVIGPPCTPPTFTICPPGLNGGYSACSPPIFYVVEASGSPAPSLSYTLSGATTGSGSGTGSGTPFNQGITFVTVTATNSCGSATCTFQCLVYDNVPPSIQCPVNTYTVAANASCQYVLGNLSSSVTASDNCSTPTISQTPAVGTPLGLGTTVATLRATDGHNNSATCTMNIQVTDQTPPAITCPVNQIMPASAQCLGIFPSFTGLATTSDNCGTPSITQLPAASTTSNLSTHVITLTATDNSGNSSSCTFYAIFLDMTPPTITCPANTTVAAGANCTASLGSFLASATATDNCLASPAIAQSPAVGTTLNLGTHTVALTTWDGAANSASCSFTVSVTDQTPPAINCPANTTVAAGANCTATLASFTAAATIIDNCTTSPAKTQSPVAGTTLNLGTQTITLTTTDAANNSATCSFNVAVSDQTAPTITCPANTTVAAGANCTAALANYTAVAIAADNCTINPAKTQSPTNGTILNLGNQTITLTATDAASNSASCSFTVSVTDQTAPTITCPANTTIVAGANCSATLANYTAAANAADNCTTSPAKTQSPVSGTILNLGNQTITLTAADAASNSASCSFTVSVTDQTPPTINCPANTTVAAGANCTAALANYTAVAIAADNCTTNPAKTQSPTNGTILNLGNQTITLTATDAASNSASCSFTVSVTDQTAPTITCPANATVAAGTNCTASLASYIASTSASDNCTANPSKTQSPASGTILNIGNQTITLTAADAASNSASCSFTVSVTDQTAPTITCPANTTIVAGANCSATLASYTAAANAADNCTTSPAKTQSPVSGTTLNLGNQTITLTAADAASNSASCSFTVSVTDQTPPTITCPANTTVAAGANCTAALANYTAVAIAADNCTTNPAKTQSPTNGTILNLGNQTITLTATDAASNSASCSFTVSVTDQTAPTITCPANATVAAGTNCTASLASYIASTSASDNCTANPSKTQNPVSGTVLNLGNQTVTLAATDAASNLASCSFIVSVTDQTPPTIACPVNIIQANTISQCGANVAFSSATATDNCTSSPSVINLSSISGSFFAIGTTPVTFRATDAAGNSATCSFTVTVNDIQAPSISCPANIAQNNTVGQCGANAVFNNATATDNCTASPVLLNLGAASGSFFAVGATAVSFRATDAAGNSATCSFTVTVNDVQAPVISCPATVTVNNSPANACSAVVNFIAPAAGDNCTVSAMILVNGLASGSAFPVGLTTNTWRATDAAGNSTTCTHTIRVNDVTLPVIVCPVNQLISAGVSCSGMVGAWSPTSLTDNCSPMPTFVQTPSPFTPLSGHNDSKVVTLQASDASNNTASCTFTVTLKDVNPPVAKCKNATLNLDPTGSATVQPALIDNISTDNCTFSLSVPTPNTFGCAQLGPNIVTLKATDAGGNTGTCTATVTIKDVTPPTALCKTITVFLDDEGHASITPLSVNNNSYDACGIAKLSINTSQFNCSQISGAPVPVQLTLQDVNNNISSCMAQVYVKDVLPPTAICSNTTVHLSASGYGVVSTAPLAANSFDNCSVWSYSPVAKVYTKANLGINSLSITVRDWSNNSATCVSQVMVIPYSGNLLAPAPHHVEAASDESTAWTGAAQLDLSVSPNPTLGESTVQFRLPEDQTYRLCLFDLNGRLLINQDFPGYAGNNSVELDLHELPAGMYLLDVRSAGVYGQQRVVVQQ